jgi:rubrerythrin
MLRHEKVADRAGALVTERVRSLIEASQARADRLRRDAADEAERLDDQRVQAASRLVSEIDELEGALVRLRQQMQSEHAEGGSYVDEPRHIEAANEPADGGVEVEADPVDEAEEPAQEPEDAEPGEDGTPATEAEGALAPEDSEESQSTRFSFLRKKDRQADKQDASPEGPDGDDPGQDGTYACVVCGRGFAGDEEELKSLGWVIADSGEVTCADCHSAGWLRPND